MLHPPMKILPKIFCLFTLATVFLSSSEDVCLAGHVFSLRSVPQMTPGHQKSYSSFFSTWKEKAGREWAESSLAWMRLIKKMPQTVSLFTL